MYIIEKNSQRGKHNLDYVLIITALILSVLGIIFIHSAGEALNTNASLKPYLKQLIALGVGFLAFIILLFFTSYKNFANYALALYLFSILILLLVIIYGNNIHGASSWFVIYGVSFQPSELTKLFFISFLAYYLTKEQNNIHKLSRLLISLAIPIPLLILILLQPDPGTAFVYIPITLAMLLIAGANSKHLFILISTGIIALTLSLLPNYYIRTNEDNIRKDQIDKMIQSTSLYYLAFNEKNKRDLKREKLIDLKSGLKLRNAIKAKSNLLKKAIAEFTIQVTIFVFILTVLAFMLYKYFDKRIFYHIGILLLILSIGVGASIFGQLLVKPHHTKRILTFMDLDTDPQGSSYHQRQSVIAIGSGGVIGHGLSEGPQNKFNFIPEKTTDFIFAVIGEEWGFLRGSLLILFLYFLIIARLLINAANARDRFGTLVISGITALITTHVFVNIAMCIGLWPVMGIPLPFLSAGGSSLVTNLIGIAIVANISKKRVVY